MMGQISGIYYQAYQLAYEMARKAEKAYKAEIFNDDTSYIKFDNWDSLHKGLFAGEKLHNDLKRLDAASLDLAPDHAFPLPGARVIRPVLRLAGRLRGRW